MFEIDGYILRHGKHKSRFSHGGPGGNNDKVGILPSHGQLVQLVKSGRNTAHPIFSVCSELNNLHRFLDNGINLNNIFFYVSL